MNPIEITDANLYKGGRISDTKIEGQGKYYLKEEGLLAKEFGKN